MSGSSGICRIPLRDSLGKPFVCRREMHRAEILTAQSPRTVQGKGYQATSKPTYLRIGHPHSTTTLEQLHTRGAEQIQSVPRALLVVDESGDEHDWSGEG